MTKKKEVPLPGYIKSNFVPDETLTKKELSLIPPYPDAGVMYAGYSKTQKTKDSFIVNLQTPFHKTTTFTSITGVTEIGVASPPTGKTLYISSLQLNTSVSAIDADTYVQLKQKKAFDSVAAEVIWSTQLLRSESIQINFSVPLKIDREWNTNSTPSGLYYRINAGGITINAISISVQGWLENN